jgi:hypothetical protein
LPAAGFEVQHLKWGRLLTGTARELLTEVAGSTETALSKAKLFLLEHMKDGPMPVTHLQHLAPAHGHSWGTILRAKKEMHVQSVQVVGQPSGGWMWQLVGE